MPAENVTSCEKNPASETSPVKLVVEGPVAHLTLNRPERRNALSNEMLQRLSENFDQIAANSGIRVVILAAEGKVFCSGHDLKEMGHDQVDEFEKLFQLCSNVMQQIRRLPQPVIAKVHALATAAGCQLVAACDLAIATPDAAFATPGVKIGLFCTTPMVPLVRSIPAKPAMEMLLTGQPISANRAHEVGLVNHVVDSDSIDDKIGEIVESIVNSSAAVIALGKKAFYDQLQLGENDAYDRACRIMTDNAVMHDAQEGISAFLEKRPPVWSEPAD